MPTLIDRNGVRADGWVRFNGDAASLPPDANVLLPLDDWREFRQCWLSRKGKVGVALAPSDDPSAIAADLPHLSLVTIDFPSFTDGRGYSIARLLRQRHGYAGELRATGDVLRDQLFLMARVGFDAWALRDDQDAAECLEAFADFSEAYQAGADRGPLFERRAARAAETVAA